MSNLSIRDTISGSVSIGEVSTKGIIKGIISIGKGEKGEHDAPPHKPVHNRSCRQVLPYFQQKTYLNRRTR